MKRHEEFILRDVADVTVIVPVGRTAERFPGMISVNETGKLLWNALEQEQTEESLTELLTAAYDVDPLRAGQDVRAFLERLRQAGALV